MYPRTNGCASTRALHLWSRICLNSLSFSAIVCIYALGFNPVVVRICSLGFPNCHNIAILGFPVIKHENILQRYFLQGRDPNVRHFRLKWGSNNLTKN